MRKISNKTLSRFTSRQRRGDIQTIANATSYSRQHVGNVMHGRRNNPRIVECALELVKGRKRNA